MSIYCDVRKRKKGTVYKYIVSVNRKHFKAKEQMTFSTKAAGKAWALHVEKEMLKQADAEEPKYESARSRTGDITLRTYLETYRAKMETLPERERISHRDMLAIKFWEGTWLAEKRSNEITEQHLIDLLDERLGKVTAATNHVYVSVLRKAIDWQKRVGLHFKRFITPEVMKELWRLKLVGKSKRDNFRPTETQIKELYTFLLDGYNKPTGSIPHHHLMLFSIYSTFREGEICSLKWTNLDAENGFIIIEDRKDPNDKYGNHQKVPIPPECLEIIAMQPRLDDEPRIFPYKAKSVASHFSEITKKLGVPELRFHSFRHEGISRLFEQKMQIPDVAARSGHQTWENLRRYTHLLHREPADLWAQCKEIEEDYWATHEVKNRLLKKINKQRSA
ncbi:tyrosine-type recombinase/integrase [Parendozoicomonas haliclonae]|uniref:Phage integrase family protein n=1 Tax=Parendozoicomonas haliclonae TaxID=1960125 RepID=A0A1X7AFP7_9GAMM|nr:integrase [Parendozoicomonas haliclonae]SMA36387.1 Phage integrase family protein [Parendozoicomonas haliclonae]